MNHYKRTPVMYGQAYKTTRADQRIMCSLFLVNIPIWVWVVSRLTF